MAIFTYALAAAMPAPCRGGVLAIGNFDGVHLGHQALVREAARQAELGGLAALAVTFDPHPSQLLRPEHLQPSLTTLDDRIALLQQHGADHVLIFKTTWDLLHLSARDFFTHIVVGRLDAQALVEGYSFGFGRDREGTTAVLQALCAENGVRLTLLPPCEVLGAPVSSSRVRAELLAGAVDVVAQFLGRPYRLRGVVGVGARRGATLGFPTANLHDVPTLHPGNGVYAVRVWHGERSWPGAANVGPNPTFGENARKIEVHLLGFAGNLYGERLAVEFLAKVRDTRAFQGPADLVAQIRADVERVKAMSI